MLLKFDPHLDLFKSSTTYMKSAINLYSYLIEFFSNLIFFLIGKLDMHLVDLESMT
jgi:hypothetical protein